MEKCVLSITYCFYVTKGVVINDMIKTYYKPIVAQKPIVSNYLLSRGYNKSPK
jgi:hypothetical protein